MIDLGQHILLNLTSMVLESMKTVHISVIKNRQREILFLLSKREITFLKPKYLEKGFRAGTGETKRS